MIEEVKLMDGMSSVCFRISRKCTEDGEERLVKIKLTPQRYAYVGGEKIRMSGAFLEGKFSKEEVERIFKKLRSRFPKLSYAEVSEALNSFSK